MTDFLGKTLVAWTKMGMRFDCIYTGYLGAPRQGDLILKFMEEQKQALKIVDPVMGDEGRLYSGVDKAMVETMGRLCAAADVATPNLTEYCRLAGEEYDARPRTPSEIADMLQKIPARAAVITSVPTEGGLFNAYRAFSGEIGLCPYERVNGHYPGTGDLFASALTGALVAGDSLKDAVRRAAAFVSHAMRLSQNTDPNHGVQLEAALPLLLVGREV
jgi:pyridoxine kinase